RTGLLDHILRRHDVPRRLGHFLALSVQHKPMRQDGHIRRAMVGDYAGQQGAVKPAAVLIRAFEIQIGRPPLARFQYRGIAHTGLEPDIQDVSLLLKLFTAAGTSGAAGHQISRRFMKPDVSVRLLNQLRHMLDDDWISKDFLTSFACEAGDRHAPDALAREAPVWPVGDHPIDAIPAPWRYPSHAIDFCQ